MSSTARCTTTSPAELDELLRAVSALENVIEQWDEQPRNTVEALRRAVDDLHREAIARIIRAVRDEPAGLAALKAALADDVVYAVLRHLELVRPSLQERLQQALDAVRPMLASHGGDVELVRVDPPQRVEIRLLGACDGCPASGLTLREGVEKAIRTHCPEITEIVKVAGGTSRTGTHAVHFVSPFAREDDAGWETAAALSDLPQQRLVPLVVDGEPLLMWRRDDRVLCYRNACAHLGLPLDGGEVVDGILSCPHHGFRYALDSGECLTAPEVQLDAQAVRVVGDRVEVRLR